MDRAHAVIKKAGFRRTELSSSRQASFDEDALSDAVLSDQLHVPLEYSVVKRFTITAPDEIRAK